MSDVTILGALPADACHYGLVIPNRHRAVSQREEVQCGSEPSSVREGLNSEVGLAWFVAAARKHMGGQDYHCPVLSAKGASWYGVGKQPEYHLVCAIEAIHHCQEA